MRLQCDLNVVPEIDRWIELEHAPALNGVYMVLMQQIRHSFIIADVPGDIGDGDSHWPLSLIHIYSGERLKFNMFADVVIHATPRAKTLHIPREALIRTGVEQRVIIALGEGRFEARPVETGIESNDQIEIRAGLKEGERVVTSAQFMLDSESSVRASLQRLTAPPKPELWAVGVINTVDPESRTVNLTHEPIQELNWPTMTMDFPTAKNFKLEQLTPGGKVRFRIHQGEDGRYEIDALEPAGAQP